MKPVLGQRWAARSVQERRLIAVLACALGVTLVEAPQATRGSGHGTLTLTLRSP